MDYLFKTRSCESDTSREKAPVISPPPPIRLVCLRISSFGLLVICHDLA